MMTTIVLAEDHKVVREGFRSILEAEEDFSIIGEAGDGLETVKLVESLEPDVLVVDIMMPGLNGLEVTRQVRERVPKTKVVVLSMYSDEMYVLRALRHGAFGYVLKNTGAGELKKAVREVSQGCRYLGPPLSERAIDAYVGGEREAEGLVGPYASLTDREREVFQLTVEGHTSKEVAERLSISPRTVDKHRSNIMKKLDVHSQNELIRYALKRGLLPEPPSSL